MDFYAISYNVADDKRQFKVAWTMDASGERMQYAEDSLRIYRLSSPCTERIESWSQAALRAAACGSSPRAWRKWPPGRAT